MILLLNEQKDYDLDNFIKLKLYLLKIKFKSSFLTGIVLEKRVGDEILKKLSTPI